MGTLCLLACASHRPPLATSNQVALLEKGGADLAGQSVSIAHDFFLRARRMELEGNESVALGYFRIAFEYDPQSRDLCFILLDHLKNAGRIDSAIALSKQCITLKGSATNAEYQAIGEAYLRKDDLKAAIQYYRKASELDENDKDALHTLANLYEKAQDLPHFAKTLETLLPRLEYPPRMVEKLFQAYTALGRIDASVPVLREAWRRTGRSAFGESLAAYYEARDMHQAFLKVAETLSHENGEAAGYELLRARALQACQLNDSAAKVYRAQLAVSPDEREVLFPYATLLSDMGKYEAAHQIFDKLAKAQPDHPLYQFFLGSVGLELKLPESKAALKNAVTLGPDLPEYRARLVYAHLVFGEDSLAKIELAQRPDSVNGWQLPLYQGLVHLHVARFLEPRQVWEPAGVYQDSLAARQYRKLAVECFRRALEQSPNNRRVLFELGSNLERLGETTAAEQTLRHLVKIDSGNSMAQNYLGYMLIEANRDLEFARQLIDKALAAEPENGAYLDSKGWWHFRKGDFSAARFFLKKASDRLPKDPTILEHLALALENLGEGEAARGIWQQLLKINPHHIEAKRKVGVYIPASKAAELDHTR